MVSPGEGWAVGNVQGTEPEGAPYGVVWQYHHGAWCSEEKACSTFLSARGPFTLQNGIKATRVDPPLDKGRVDRVHFGKAF